MFKDLDFYEVCKMTKVHHEFVKRSINVFRIYCLLHFFFRIMISISQLFLLISQC